MSGDDQRRRALRVANERRILVAGFKRDLRAGRVTIPDVMEDRPEIVKGYALLDLIRWARDSRSEEAIEEINEKALAQFVNLLVPLGRASTRLRRFVALHWDYRHRQESCINGHEFTEENTYIREHGYRQCRICRRARDNARVAA